MARDLVSWCAEDWAEVSLLCEVVAVAGVSPLEEGALGKPSVSVEILRNALRTKKDTTVDTSRHTIARSHSSATHTRSAQHQHVSHE